MTAYTVGFATTMREVKLGVSACRTNADFIHDFLKGGVMGQIAYRAVCHPCLYLVEPFAQLSFFRSFAIVPWASLQAHNHCIIANEMWGMSAVEQAEITLVGAKRAQGFGTGDPCAGKGRIRGWAKVAD